MITPLLNVSLFYHYISYHARVFETRMRTTTPIAITTTDEIIAITMDLVLPDFATGWGGGA